MGLADGRKEWAEGGGADRNGFSLPVPNPYVHPPHGELSGWAGSIESTDSLKMASPNLPVPVKGGCACKGRG